jgi:hypothetical protein
METPSGDAPLPTSPVDFDYNQDLVLFDERLGLPDGFSARSLPSSSAKVDLVLSLKAAQPRRTYLLGLYWAYIGVVEQLLSQVGLDSVDDVLVHYPSRETVGKKGTIANTLTLGEGSNLISLRTYYNWAEHVIRHDLNRPDYPNSAPHATQSWTQHQQEFELIAAMTPGERALLAQDLWRQTLAISESVSDADGVRELRPFEFLLDNFASVQKGEPGGAVLQGLAYAYYRADSPTVTLRVFKVGSGSTRVGAAGDVDGWIGAKLALSVEVKDRPIGESDLSQFDQFLKQLMRWPNATAVVLARSFDAKAESWLAERNVLTLDRPRMASNVAYWDLPKQQMAVREFTYFLNVIQVHAKLITRFTEFCELNSIEIE